MKSVLGAIFPISSENAVPIFDGGRRVFVKYTKFGKLSKDSKLVFYVSKEKRLIGEGTIERVEKANSKIAWVQYGHQMFINEPEFSQYASKSPVDGRSRKMEEITVFILKKARRYKNPVQWKCGITPAGCYLTMEMYQRITRANKTITR